MDLASSNKKDNKKKQERLPADPNFAHNIPIGNSVVLGNPDASIVLTKFTDFQWPHCASSVSLIDEVLEKYPNDVKVVIKNFPLSFHKEAKLAAQYALAAHKQGKYKEMYHKIFEKYRDLKTNPKLPEQIAAELNLDVEQLIADINSNDILNLIDEENRQLRALENAYRTKDYAGVRLSVPKFFINGREPSGRSLASFTKVIEEELKK